MDTLWLGKEELFLWSLVIHFSESLTSGWWYIFNVKINGWQNIKPHWTQLSILASWTLVWDKLKMILFEPHLEFMTGSLSNTRSLMALLSLHDASIPF